MQRPKVAVDWQSLAPATLRPQQEKGSKRRGQRHEVGPNQDRGRRSQPAERGSIPPRSGDRSHRQHPAAPQPARRSSAAQAGTETPGCEAARPADATPTRAPKREPARNVPQTSSAPNSGTTSAAAAMPPSGHEQRHDNREARWTDRDDRARHGRRRHMPDRSKRQRRVRPRRLQRQRLGHLQAARCPALRLVQIAVGVRPARDKAFPRQAHGKDGGDEKRDALSASSQPLGEKHLSARTPSRQPIFLPCARDRGSNRTGSSWMRWPRRSSRAVISGSMSKRLAVSSSERATSTPHDLVAGLHVGQRRRRTARSSTPVSTRLAATVTSGAPDRPSQKPRPVDDARPRRRGSGATSDAELLRDRARGRRPGWRRSTRVRMAQPEADRAALAAVLRRVQHRDRQPVADGRRPAPAPCRRSSRRRRRGSRAARGRSIAEQPIDDGADVGTSL